MRSLQTVSVALTAACAAAALLAPSPAIANLKNPTPDVPWKDADGKKRPRENCGSIAVVNLLRLLDNEHDRMVKNNKDKIDDLKDRVENALKDAGGKADWTGDAVMVKALEALLKQSGYKGVIDRMPKYGGQTLDWNWIVDQWKNKKEKLCLLVKDGKDAEGNDINHWLTVLDVDPTAKTVAVTDPNTPNNSENMNDAGGRDTYPVNTGGLTFELPYDFRDETIKDDKSPVKIIWAVKVSDITNDTSKKEKASAGSKSSPQLTFDPASQVLSFSPMTLNFADQAGGLTGGIDPRYQGDPILGATLEISPLILDSLIEDVVPYGALFSGGTAAISKAGITYLESTFECFTMVENTDLSITSNQAILNDVYINPGVNSTWLDDFAQTVIASPASVPGFYAESVVPGQSLLAQMGFLQGSAPVTVDVDAAICGNPVPNVPEPASCPVWLLLAAAAIAVYRRRSKKSPHPA